jgi:hypothetical protein
MIVSINEACIIILIINVEIAPGCCFLHLNLQLIENRLC